MAVVSGNFPPGPYQMTFQRITDGSPLSVGLMEGPIRHQQSPIGLPIRASLWGQNVLNYIMQGGGVFVVMVLKEWNTATKAVMHPFNTSMGIFPKAGMLLDQYYGEVILTALAGTPAATNGPVTRTYASAGILPGHSLDVALGPIERNVPIVLAVLPEQNGSTVGEAKYFTDT